jgi:hypothetical protein
MTDNGKIAAAVVGGYLLGRTKKAKMAIGLGMFLAGKKLSLDPAKLGKLVANSPVIGSLNTQVRKELVEATKSAATSALSKRASGLADSLHERSAFLDDPDSRGTRDEDVDDEDTEDDDRDAEDRDAEDSESTDEEPQRRRKPAAKKSGGTGRPAARRSASGTARKTTSAARKTTSGARKNTTRSTKNSGGSDA